MKLIERKAVYDAIERGLTPDEIHYRVMFLPDTPAISINAIEKIKAKIKEKYGGYDICEWDVDYDFDDNDISEYRMVGDVSDILNIIDSVIKEYTE